MENTPSNNWLQSVSKWFNELFDLNKGLDSEGTILAIKTNKSMSGANAWLLICSIMIAAIGLDLNSAAVIIGAMLISPLMSPILGIGLGIAINDMDAFYVSLRHFSIAIVIALISSTVYFLLTPLGDATDQILMRTEPTFLDGLVAVFGGFAGIISISRKDTSNAIPGVAIATALMPPLCVSGYGIANGNWTVMINAFYLFFLNSFFIAITTFILIRFMNFRFHKYQNRREQRRTQWILLIFSLILVIPSTTILYRLWQKNQDEKRAEQYVQDNFGSNSLTKCIDYELSYSPGDTSKVLILKLLGPPISIDSLPNYERDLEKWGLKNVRLSLIQESDLELAEIKKMKVELNNLGTMAERFNTMNEIKFRQENTINDLTQQIDSLKTPLPEFQSIANEVKVVFPNINSLAFATVQKTEFDSTSYPLPVFIVDWQNGRNRSRITQEKKLTEFLLLRASLDTLQLINQ